MQRRITWLRRGVLSHVQPVSDLHSRSMRLAARSRYEKNTAEKTTVRVLVPITVGDTNSRLRPIAALIGTKPAIVLSLVLWSGVVVYAYGFLQTTTQAWAMGAMIAVVLGAHRRCRAPCFHR